MSGSSTLGDYFPQGAYYLGNLQGVGSSGQQFVNGPTKSSVQAAGGTLTLTALPVNSVATSTFTLPDTITPTTPKPPSGRIFFFIEPPGSGAPTVQFNLQKNSSGTVEGLGFASPPEGPGGVSSGYFGYLEFTEAGGVGGTLDIDWSTVNSYEFPLTMSAVVGGTTYTIGANPQPAGTQPAAFGRADVFNVYQPFITKADPLGASSPYLQLPFSSGGVQFGIQSPLQFVSTLNGAADPFQHTFDTALNAVFVSQPGQLFLQDPTQSGILYTASPVTVGGKQALALWNSTLGSSMANPTYYIYDPRTPSANAGTQSPDLMIFGDGGVFANTGDNIGPGPQSSKGGATEVQDLLNELNEALNRGIVTQAGVFGQTNGTANSLTYWANESHFYPNGVQQNFYAAFLHTVILGGQPVNTPNPTSPQNSAQGTPMGLAYGFTLDETPNTSNVAVNPQYASNPGTLLPGQVPLLPDGSTLNVTLDFWGMVLPAPNGNSVPSVAAVPGVAPANAVFAVSADAGGGPQVTIYNALTGKAVTSFNPFPANFTGGVRVAVADVNGDGIPDIICGAGPSGGPQVSIYDGKTLQLIRSFFALPSSFTGGVFVAAGDINGDGYADIVVSADKGGGPEVTIFDGKTGNQLTAFFATAPTFTGGIRIAVGDVNGDGFADVIAAAGPGGGPQVTIFDGKTMKLLTSFFAFPPTFTGGLWVAAGDINGDGFTDIIVGADKGGGPQVTVFDGSGVSANNTQAPKALANFFAFSSGFTGGVRVGIVETASGRDNILAGAGPGAGPEVAVFDGLTQQMINAFFALPSGFTGGVFVGGV
jgi:hypothetical protein